MGACDFFTTAKGRTAEEAFRNAVSNAQYQCGHGGYTGTIAEKDSFTDLTGRFKAFDIWRLFKEKIAKLKAAAKSEPKGWQRDNAKSAVAHVEHAYKHFREREKKDAVSKAHAMADALFSLDYGDDKWGPAMCLRVKRGEYLFFGLASS